MREVAGLPHLRVRALAEVGSTNVLAMEAARAGDPGGLWILGGRQVEGRGRRARPWVSEPGNLYASYLVLDPASGDRLAQLPLVAALALSEAVDEMCGTYALAKLKWPNDQLVDGAKISGILLEATSLPNGSRAVVMGFGLNLVHHPDLADYRAADLAGLGYQVDVGQAFAALAGSLERRLVSWNGEAGGDRLMADWQARATGLGKAIRVRFDSGETHGIFEGLDEIGRLRLRLEDGTLTSVSAGDVFFGNGS